VLIGGVRTGGRRNVKILHSTPSIIRTNRLVIRPGKFWHSQSGTSFVHRFLASPSEARPQPLKGTLTCDHTPKICLPPSLPEPEEVKNRSRLHSPPVVGVDTLRTVSFCRRREGTNQWLPVGISRNGDVRGFGRRRSSRTA